MPKSPHGCDFSRVKNWYLDEQAKYLRQTVLLSRYDTPETRSLFHKHCFNLEGKIRLEKNDYPGVLGYIKPGVKQVFERFDGDSRKGLGGDAAVEEVDQRLDWFVKKVCLFIHERGFELTRRRYPHYNDLPSLVNRL